MVARSDNFEQPSAGISFHCAIPYYTASEIDVSGSYGDMMAMSKDYLLILKSGVLSSSISCDVD